MFNPHALLDKWRNMSPVAKTSFALVFATLVQKGLSLLSGPIFTRIMPQAEYGTISTFISWQSVLIIFATLNLQNGVFNNGMLEFKEDRDNFIFSLLCLSGLSTTICGVVYIVFYSLLQPIVDMPDILMVIMFIYFITTPAYSFWMGRQRFEFQYKSVLTLSVLSAILSTIAAIVFVLIVPDNLKATAKVISSEGVAIIIGIVFCCYIIYKAKGKFKIHYWKYALAINLPLVPHYLSMYILASSDRVMITKLIDSSATAVYSTAYTVATIMLVFWNAIDAAFAPWIYQKMEQKEYASIRKRGNQILTVLFIMTVCVSLLAPEIIWILAPPSYYDGVWLIPAIATSVYFTALYSLAMRIELYLKKTKIVMIGTIGTAVLNLFSNWIFIPIFGFYAAAYTTLVCYIILSIVHILFLRKLGYKHIYFWKFIYQLSTILIVSMCVVLFLYPYRIMRLSFVIICGLYLYKKKNDVFKILKK